VTGGAENNRFRENITLVKAHQHKNIYPILLGWISEPREEAWVTKSVNLLGHFD